MALSHTSRLADLCEITSGPSGQQLAELSAGLEGVPVISAPDLTSNHAITTAHIKRVSPGTAVGLARYRVQQGDLIYVRQGTLGRRAVVGPAEATWLFGAACLRLRPKTGMVLPEYLLHYLGHPLVHDWIAAHANKGQAVETLNSRTLAETPVMLPSLDRQRVIAGAMREIGNQIDAHAQLIAKHESFRVGLLTELMGDGFSGSEWR
ncbi:restriction endonuclease subunit S [Streptomyces sp. NPDC127166]|uniref:restriction endonuclease subunit S n=1 Tax=Streptomyces sp. NPDC127166 TaxID=3345380 RepID=UPI00363B7FF2